MTEGVPASPLDPSFIGLGMPKPYFEVLDPPEHDQEAELAQGCAGKVWLGFQWLLLRSLGKCFGCIQGNGSGAKNLILIPK